MPALIAILEKAKALVTNMLEDIVVIYTDKGFAPFQKPVGFAFAALFILYLAVYSPLSSKVKNKALELEKLRLISMHAAEYQDAKTRYGAYQHRLPLIKDKDEWLNYVMTSTAKKQGIQFDMLSAQTESEVGNFLLISREATVTTNYSKLGKWIADMENSPILLKVSEVDIKRDAAVSGVIKVTIKVSTIFSRFASRPAGQ